MSQMGSDDIYYPFSWIKTTTDLVLNLFSSPQKTKRSLPEEAECGSVDGIKCWLREGKFELFIEIISFFNIYISRC
jgi:hypothetical protein